MNTDADDPDDTLDAFRLLPGWARLTIYICGGIAAMCIQFGSSWSLGSLALFAGLGWPRCLLLPVALDLGAIVAGVLWVAAPRGTKMRNVGRNVTIGLVLSSMSFNGLDAAAAQHRLSPDQLLWIAVGIAIIFPLTAALIGHIVFLVRESDSAAAHARRQARREEAARKARTAKRVPVREAAPEPSHPVRTPMTAKPTANDPAPTANVQVKSKQELAREHVLREVSAGRGHELTGPKIDAVVGGSGTGRLVLGKMRAAGECPELGKPWTKPVLAAVAND